MSLKRQMSETVYIISSDDEAGNDSGSDYSPPKPQKRTKRQTTQTKNEPSATPDLSKKRKPKLELNPENSKFEDDGAKPIVKRCKVEGSNPKIKEKKAGVKPVVKRHKVEGFPPKPKLKKETTGIKKKPAASRARKKTVSNTDSSNSSWDIVEEISSLTETPLDISMNVINLLDSENTIPFIARYRKELTGNMEASKLRQLEDVYETLKSVKLKTQSVMLTVKKMGKLTESLQKALDTTKSLDELDHLYAPFKLGRKSLAEKARALGLESLAMNLLQNPLLPINLRHHTDTSKKGLETVEKVSLGIQHIISEIISKDYEVIKKIQTLFPTSQMMVECKMNKNFAKKVDTGETNGYKFELYYDYKNRASRLQSHQILAINRGENLKVLSVKVKPDQFSISTLQDFILRHFFQGNHNIHYTNSSLMTDSIAYCYSHSIEPLIERRVRSELTRSAEKESVAVFATNLSNLLLTAPLHGKVVMAIDPGYTHGCKLAVVGKTGDILHTETLMLLGRNKSDRELEKLVRIVLTHSCDVIAIGNGTGCRDVEAGVAYLIANKAFNPVQVSYCIVNESGVSIYSCSDQAAEELPNLDSNLRSAVSLARRVIDPLSEYIKVEPRHLGVGMYQHDINKNILKKTLDNVIEECISFTGIDINTCSQIALSKIAGLKGQKSQAIMAQRKALGGFTNREQIKKVPGIGPKTFEQCAGFLRISASTLQSCKKDTNDTKVKKNVANVNCSVNMLDSTIIHPESYDVALKIIKRAGCNAKDIGTQQFIKVMESFMTATQVELLAKEFSIGIPTILLISDGLKKSFDYDIRKEFNAPLFKQEFRDMSSLKVGMVLSGKVMNCCTFGAFVDVGVDRDGLIHNSQMNSRVLDGRKLGVGDCVEAKVISIDTKKNKFALSLHAILERPKVVLR